MIELLRNSKDKRARKLAKKRVSTRPRSLSPRSLLCGDGRMYGADDGGFCLQLGTFGRAKRKVDELQRVIAESRRAGGH